jgi:NAD(P)-dependent dehydrogenase (short-subunit alcohol dehydrogenase family)
MNRFADKVVLVVGGNSGIGLAVAKAFSREGARVVITGRNEATLNSATEQIGGATARCSDIRDLGDIERLFAEVRERFGRLDVLFVNAGVALLKPIGSITETDWNWVQETNLKGAFFCVQFALPIMEKGSSIVLTGSIAANIGEPTASVYAASKAGLRALGRSFAAELVERGIRVNVVTPGPVETPLLERVNGIPAEIVPALRRGMIDRNPMKRLGRVEEVAAAVLFLSSDDAEFITGIDLPVDGGAGEF